MNLKNMTTNRLKAEIIKCEKDIKAYEEALEYLPVDSILGRWSIEFSIKNSLKKLKKLNKELSLRADK